VPFHLSFNFLLDVVSAARSEGQPLTETLARLQQAAIGDQGGSSSWSGEQIKVLETLLGKDFLERISSMSSQDVLQFLHSELSGRLDSESASELLAKGRLASMLAPGESSLFSSSIREFLRHELASGGVSSFGSSEVGGVSSQIGGLSSQVGGTSSELGNLSSEVLAGGSETLASWQAGVRAIILKWEQALSSLGLGSEVLASWHAGLGEIASSFSGAVTSYGFSSETLASWQTGVSEIFAKWESALSSYGVSSEFLASWQAGFGEITSSWETVLSSYGLSSYSLSSSSYGLSSEVLSSWETAFGSYNVSSFSFGSEQLSSFYSATWSGLESGPTSWGGLEFGPTSWSGLEFGLSSWGELVSESSLYSGVGASWSGQSFGQSEREFFMHVNAEVIFYGGTDPQAKVTIAGKPVQLQPDGTFRYHFKFPDNDFEIPIVAVSPDGVETRSAVLSLRRDTTRYGDVGATAQPEYLDIPMGQLR
jgi:hypothetical protein